MRITKRGVDPEERLWVGRCRNCGTDMEGTSKEMRCEIKSEFLSKFSRRRNKRIYGSDCLVCNKFVEFNLKPPEDGD